MTHLHGSATMVSVAARFRGTGRAIVFEVPTMGSTTCGTGRTTASRWIVWPTTLALVCVASIQVARAQPLASQPVSPTTPSTSPSQRLQDRAFERAKGRVSSSEYARRRAEPKRQEAIARQLALEAIVQWRSGIVAASPAGPPWSTPGMPSPPLRYWPGSNDIYSPFWRGPFEPTPFWPGYIYGYPFIDPIEQPIGTKLTAKGGDPARGYVYEPVYASDEVEQADDVEASLGDERALSDERAAAAAQSPSGAPVAAPPRPATTPAASQFLRRAIEAFRAADYQRALLELTHVHAEVPDHGPANLLRGQCYLAVGDYEAAAAAIRLACRKMPADTWGLVLETSAELYANSDELAAHLRALEAHVEQQPDDESARFALGFEYLYLGFAAEAVHELDQAIAVAAAGPAPEGVNREPAAADPIVDVLLRRARAISRSRAPTRQHRVREL